ncbi:SLC13 family permease [Lacticaseibacillus saniviri]|uniref:Di-and tricarboxylate transporter n=1 Tax=Lacticaseibacillus saniviri JCM 17471 = DSM 24301 TaxID=1293598 RepID=A0A0R2MRT0_9LACO|nr:SLC13 family permease [Lacticaseibacillus saniviri]KRO16305.1 di-and tricarboxylate transporter [Lacticaseibacillus saniviri JCM 17471 = DSM 24301]MCG4281873.1 cation transporter [Lacticaseibacillus saniviri]
MTVIKKTAKDPVLQITVILALASLFFARPKLADINFSTLWSLLGMMTIIQIFEYLHILDYWAYRLTSNANNTRQLTRLFIVLALVSGMFLTNDVTVLTLIPLYLRIAKKYNLPEIIPVTLIGMAANFGSAFTPFGNPHNIFILMHYQVPALTFFKWSLPLLLADILILTVFSFFVKPTPVPEVPVRDIRIQMRPTLVTVGVALLIFAGVFGVLPTWVGAIAAVALAIGLNPVILQHVDYAIILTFTGFFIIVSNISQIPWLVATLGALEKSPTSVYLSSILTSQFISNVPSTVLLAKFTPHAAALFYGSNIGGLGSIVGSMANLLVFKQYSQFGNHDRKRFFAGFTAVNFAGLLILGTLGWLLAITVK